MSEELFNATLSRRNALQLGALAGAGAFALAGCSNEGRGGPVSTDGADLPLPNSKPYPQLDGMILSQVGGVPPAYTTLPSPGVQTVTDKPGKGGDISSLTITWGPAPKLDSSNQWYAAVNAALGATLKPIVVPAQSFGDRLVTTIASGDIPDITTNEPSYRGRGARKYLPQGVFHDLRKFLGGDKVDAYPNLALVPAYAWQNSLINGAVYGVPCYRNQTIGGTILYRSDWAAKGGFDGKPTTADELFRWLQAMQSGGGKGSYPLATLDQTLGFCGKQVYKVPNTWRRDGNSLVAAHETDEYEAALAFAAKIWKAGLVHPNMLTLTPNPTEYQGQFYAGRVGLTNGSIDSYYGLTGQIAKLKERDSAATADVLVPPGADGGVGMVPPDLGYYCMLSIPSSVTDEERIHELLGIINYLAAPMGSQEYLLVHYGVEGHNYTMENGLPKANTDADLATESFLSMLGSFSNGFFFPGAPADDAATCQRYAEQMVAAFVPNPANGLDSEASFSKGDALAAMILDYEGAIVTGRRPVSDVADLRSRWKASGGDQMRRELESQLS